MVLYSFGNSQFFGFVEGKSGLHIFFPDGDKTVTVDGSSMRHWALQWWYNSLDVSSYGNGYGRLAWAIDNASPEKNEANNWFELLDSWFDESNTSAGGLNFYQW